MAVVVLGPTRLMGAKDTSGRPGWTIHGVEELLQSLTGVMSVRIVAKPGSSIDEIHVLTSYEVTPKQTVRNVESALLAHFDLEIDHRKISVAQSSNAPTPQATPAEPARGHGPPVRGHASPSPSTTMKPMVRPLPTSAESRILLLGHQIEIQRSQRVRMIVSLEWQGQRFEGEASGPDVARGRMDAVAKAAIAAVEAAVSSTEGVGTFTLTLDGVTLLDAFDREYVLVAVHAMSGRNVTHLAGSAVLEDTADKAIIMAVLQATDRWVRGRV
jgi:hypothetical protein